MLARARADAPARPAGGLDGPAVRAGADGAALDCAEGARAHFALLRNQHYRIMPLSVKENKPRRVSPRARAGIPALSCYAAAA
jgi:hypothetical protein